MYRNIGKKIKGLAITVFILEAIASLIWGLFIIGFETDSAVFVSFSLGARVTIGLLTIGIGFLVSWISSWLLYGFGELIDKTADVERNTRCAGGKPMCSGERTVREQTYKCPACNRPVYYGEPKCRSCGQSFYWY